MKLHLIQPRELYGPDSRQAELAEAWANNNALFNAVTIPEGRPTFTDLFAMCRADAVNVIANSDIYFDHTLRDNIHKLDEDEVWALSRWDDAGTTLVPYHRADSQDAWIVRGGPHEVEAPYTMGMPGCDNAIAHELVKRRYMVTNPCMTVKAIHLHRSGYRTYRTGPGRPKQYVVPPPYTLVLPCAL
jgi:hypothetical protein